MRGLDFRKFHIYIGGIFSVFYIITGFAAILVLIRRLEIYDIDRYFTFLQLHNWEIIGSAFGVIVALVLLHQTVTGIFMLIQSIPDRGIQKVPQISLLHRITGFVFLIFFFILASTALLLLFRKTGIYSVQTYLLLKQIHSWEIISPYIGIILALALFTQGVTGVIMFIRHVKAKKK